MPVTPTSCANPLTAALASSGLRVGSHADRHLASGVLRSRTRVVGTQRW